MGGGTRVDRRRPAVSEDCLFAGAAIADAVESWTLRRRGLGAGGDVFDEVGWVGKADNWRMDRLIYEPQ